MAQPFSSIACTSLHGIDARMVRVEVSVKSRGSPGWAIVGLPDTQIKESKERVIAAIQNCGLEWPQSGFVINLSPAFEKKAGTSFDLPIAIAIQCALQDNDRLVEETARYAIIGELSLDGGIKRVRGALSSALAALKAGYRRMIVPEGNASEAALVDGLEVFPVQSLPKAVDFLSGVLDLPAAVPAPASAAPREDTGDFRDVKGQAHAKRAVEIAAAGNHNVMLIGPPGAGKTMLARRLPAILPALGLEEALEVTKIHSVAGLLRPGAGLVAARPFRAPHHSISNAGLIGGGSFPRPGEVSLAHNGVLFLDELPELPRHNLELLRQPLEDGRVSITRASWSVSFPCRFVLVAAMNPCPCGFFQDDTRPCVCTPVQVQRYRDRISGPLLDRIDLHVDMPAVRFRELQEPMAESSEDVAARVRRAREIQTRRFAGTPTRANGHMGAAEVKQYCRIGQDSRDLLEAAFRKLGLSVRAYHRILKVSRTIADLLGEDSIQARHVAEAVGYRTLDRSWFDPEIPGTP